jgi:hypothetical protein
MSKMSFEQFGIEFVKNIFTVQRLKQELDKGFVKEVAINTKEATGTATIYACTVVHLPKEGRPEWERVFDVIVPISMYLRIDLPLGQEKYKVTGQVRMRLWLEAYPPLVIYLNGLPVPKSEVHLVATGDGNWLNADIAKKFGLEDKLKESMAKQFSDEFAKSQKSRVTDILALVK